MSEENPHGAHPVAVSNNYAQVSQTHGGVYHPGVAPSSSTHPSYGYREGGPGYSMNGIAGGTHPFHATMPATPRGGPSQNVAPAHWPSNYYQAPVSQETIQPAHAPASYPTPSEHSGSWKVPPGTSFLRSQSSSQDQNFSHAQNYSLNYSRPHHNPMEPIAAPSPPNPYPGSPRTPVSAHHTAGSNGIPQPQPFRPPNPPNKRPLTPSTAAPRGLSLENAAHRAEPASRYTESSMLPRNQVRGHMASPLGPPKSSNGAHRGSFNNTHRNNENYGSQSVEDGGKGPERRVSTPTTRRNHDSQSGYDSADEEASKRIKLERNSREPSISLSPRTVRIDHGAGSDDRSPSFSGSATKDLKTGGLEMQGKKKGQPVFRDANGNEYYENELVPPGVPIPDGWQRGTGKQTKDLLLPHMKDGISVNPEWGFTAGGKARQRLPQACKNCRAKKIRCV
jgi:hypothetical protein